MRPCLDPRPSLPQADRFDAEAVAGRQLVVADALEPQSVVPGVGPEVEQVIFPVVDFAVVEVENGADFDAIELGLVAAEIVGAGHLEQ